VEVNSRIESFYVEKEEQIKAMANELRGQKEEELRRIQSKFEGIIEDLKRENELMNTDIRTMKIDYANKLMDVRKLEEINTRLHENLTDKETLNKETNQRLKALQDIHHSLQAQIDLINHKDFEKPKQAEQNVETVMNWSNLGYYLRCRDTKDQSLQVTSVTTMRGQSAKTEKEGNNKNSNLMDELS